MIGHEGEISKVQFSPSGHRVITAASDRTCRIWNVETGECQQILEGHTDEIFSCAYNYQGDTIITGSKDNTCRIWKGIQDSDSSGGGGSGAGDEGGNRSGGGAQGNGAGQAVQAVS